MKIRCTTEKKKSRTYIYIYKLSIGRCLLTKQLRQRLTLIDLGGCSLTQPPPPPPETQTGWMSRRLLAVWRDVIAYWSVSSLSWRTVCVNALRRRDYFPGAAEAGRTHKGPRMVLVHVGYLVLPVFGSVRNRGMVMYFIYLLQPYFSRRDVFPGLSVDFIPRYLTPASKLQWIHAACGEHGH